MTKCKCYRYKTIYRGPLRPDPKHPNDRRYDERTVRTQCVVCGKIKTSIECPNLLIDIFSLPK